MNHTKQKPNGFQTLGLSSDLVKIVHNQLKFTTPTPIQEQAIPLAVQGKDVIGIAQTGTGKTLAFCLPILHRLKTTNGSALVVAPTRELARQVRVEFDRIGKSLGYTSALVVGGVSVKRQIHELKKQPDLIAATPGRLIDHIQRKTVKLHTINSLVLDEADRMLDMGFAPQINKILKVVPNDRQTALYSATMPQKVANIGRKHMRNPVRVEVEGTGMSAKHIDQGMYYVRRSNKLSLLKDLLQEHKNEPILVFCRTKRGTKKMAKRLGKDGYRTEELHSNRSMNQRRRALKNFKNGKSRVMVATDVAARGLDVDKIGLVVNYDLPDNNEDYVHRIGRTGRAGHEGRAVSFASPDQHRDVKAIERLIDEQIDVLRAEHSLSEKEAKRTAGNSRRKKRGGRRRRSR